MYSPPKIIASLDANVVLVQALGDDCSTATADVSPLGHGCK